MALPEHPVNLTPQQVADLNKRLILLRHDIKGFLGVQQLAAELFRFKPESGEEMVATVMQQVPKIIAACDSFTADFERTLGITRGQSGSNAPNPPGS